MGSLGERGGLSLEESMDSGPELDSESTFDSGEPSGFRRSHPSSHMRMPSAV